MNPKVYVTGLGVISSIGNNVSETIKSLTKIEYAINFVFGGIKRVPKIENV